LSVLESNGGDSQVSEGLLGELQRIKVL
jgi:hypothetical protein